MTARAHPLTREQQRDVGAAVVAARAQRVGWKQLEEEFGLERTQLWRCARLYALLMQQQTLGMQQQDCCADAEPA